MLDHKGIWTALDKLADKFSMSPSGLARQAGLDPTTFNKSKRCSADGKPRWPSTESLSKVLNMLSVDFSEFAALAVNKRSHQRHSSFGLSVPVIGLAQAGDDGFFDDSGFPVGEGWEDISVPGLRDSGMYALQISGDSMAPVLRHGDRIVVAPNERVKRGDRVVVKTSSGEIMAKELKRMNQNEVELLSLNPDYPGRTLAMQNVNWIARIIWVTQ